MIAHEAATQITALLSTTRRSFLLNWLLKGGHFAAWEQQTIFSDELRAAFKSLR